MNQQRYEYTYDKALDIFFVRDLETDELVLKCHNEAVAVVFIYDLLSGNIDISTVEELPIDMTEQTTEEVEVEV